MSPLHVDDKERYDNEDFPILYQLQYEILRTYDDPSTVVRLRFNIDRCLLRILCNHVGYLIKWHNSAYFGFKKTPLSTRP